MRFMHFSVLLLIAAPLASHAGELHCTDIKGEHHWVKSILVSPSRETVTIHVAQGMSPRQALLVNAAETQFGKPVYAFNLPPLPGNARVTNVFKLFHTGQEWRLIEAGLLEVGGTFTLRALGQSVAFHCTERGT